MDAKHWISLSCLRRWKGRSQPFLLPTQSILSSGYRLQKLPQERLKNKLNKLRVQTNLFCIVFNFLQTPAFSLLRGKNSGGKCARLSSSSHQGALSPLGDPVAWPHISFQPFSSPLCLQFGNQRIWPFYSSAKGCVCPSAPSLCHLPPPNPHLPQNTGKAWQRRLLPCIKDRLQVLKPLPEFQKEPKYLCWVMKISLSFPPPEPELGSLCWWLWQRGHCCDRGDIAPVLGLKGWQHSSRKQHIFIAQDSHKVIKTFYLTWEKY